MTDPLDFELFTKIITSSFPAPEMPLATWRSLWKMAHWYILPGRDYRWSDVCTAPPKDVAVEIYDAFSKQPEEAIPAWKKLVREARTEKYGDPPHPFHPIPLAHFFRTLLDANLIAEFFLRSDLPEDKDGFRMEYHEWRKSLESPTGMRSRVWGAIRQTVGRSRGGVAHGIVPAVDVAMSVLSSGEHEYRQHRIVHGGKRLRMEDMYVARRRSPDFLTSIQVETAGEEGQEQPQVVDVALRPGEIGNAVDTVETPVREDDEDASLSSRTDGSFVTALELRPNDSMA